LLIDGGIRHLYVFGTAGEGYAVSEGQFDEVVRIFDEETRPHGIDPMIGIISLSLPTIVERIERCLDRGMRTFQISLPAWGALTGTEVDAFFHETCGRFPEAQFLHYNLPRTKRFIAPEEYETLAHRHPNLVATKNSGANAETLQALFSRAGMLRHFITESSFATGIRMGECGFLISVASINLRLAQEYFAAGMQGDDGKLQHLADDCMRIGRLLIETVGPDPHIDGAYDKVFCKLHDAEFPLRLLPPYQDYGEAAFTRFREALAANFPEWLIT
jgi:dihydrodipicolinate synthase/N-acetylneuraminate lyase